MRVRSILMSAVCCVAISAISMSAVARDTLPTPIPIEVTLRSEGEGNAQRVAGNLVATDDDGITMHVGETDKGIRVELNRGSRLMIECFASRTQPSE